MQKLDLVKSSLRLVVGIGAGKIVKDVIKHNTLPKNKVDVVTYAAGAYAIGGIVAQASKDFVDTEVEKALELIEKARGRAEKIDLDNLKETGENVKETLSKSAKEAAEHVKPALADEDDSPQS